MPSQLSSTKNDLNTNANALALDTSLDTGSQIDVFSSNDPVNRIRRVSSSSKGVQADAPSNEPAISANGRFVAFESDATNLVRGDTNGVSDIFVRNVRNGNVIRVSVGASGTQANGASFNASISGDGRFVVFQSDASNLVPNDTNGKTDVFLHDTRNGSTTRISVDSRGNQAGEISFAGRISRDGRFVTFSSQDRDLDGNAPSFFGTNVFLRDIQAGTTTRIVSPSEAGFNDPSFSDSTRSTAAAISGDGRYVVYQTVISIGRTAATLFVYDKQTQTSQRIDSIERSSFRSPSISDDGRYIAYHKVVPFLPAISTKIYDQQTKSFRDILQDPTRRNGIPISGLSLSGNGRYLAFSSSRNNIVPNDTNSAEDVFVYDIENNTTQRVSVNARGEQANGVSFSPSISADGRFLAFASDASNLVPRDTNGVTDVFRVKTYSN
jgi:Tol biopolymer transport system component